MGVFEQDRTPDLPTRQQLAARLNLTNREVQVSGSSLLPGKNQWLNQKRCSLFQVWFQVSDFSNMVKMQAQSDSKVGVLWARVCACLEQEISIETQGTSGVHFGGRWPIVLKARVAQRKSIKPDENRVVRAKAVPGSVCLEQACQRWTWAHRRSIISKAHFSRSRGPRSKLFTHSCRGCAHPTFTLSVRPSTLAAANDNEPRDTKSATAAHGDVAFELIRRTREATPTVIGFSFRRAYEDNVLTQDAPECSPQQQQ